MEAEQRGVEWEIIPDSDIVKFTYNGQEGLIRKGVPSTNLSIASRICAHKNLTRTMLREAGLPIMKGFALRSSDTPEYRNEVFSALQKPLVVKPAASTQGDGVKLNIKTLEEMNAHVDFLFNTVSSKTLLNPGLVLVEESALGSEYRIVVTQEKVLAVMNRKPASVMADGEHTIQQLIDVKNTDELRNISDVMYPHITPDDDLITNLKEQGLTLDSIPAKDQHVVMRKISNIMAGGDAYDITDDVHPSVMEIGMKTIQAIPGMSFVGLDFISTDIYADQSTQQCAVIEVNSAPGYAMHDYPMYGKKRFIAFNVLKLLFPELQQ